MKKLAILITLITISIGSYAKPSDTSSHHLKFKEIISSRDSLVDVNTYWKHSNFFKNHNMYDYRYTTSNFDDSKIYSMKIQGIDVYYALAINNYTQKADTIVAITPKELSNKMDGGYRAFRTTIIIMIIVAIFACCAPAGYSM